VLLGKSLSESAVGFRTNAEGKATGPNNLKSRRWTERGHLGEPVAWAGETCLTEPTRQAHPLKFGVIADITGQNDDVLTSGIKCFYTVANPTTSG